VTSVALAFRPPPSAALPPHPVLLPPDPDGPLTTAHDVVHRLRTVERLVNVARASDPAPLAARVKDIIDAEYATTLDIGRIAVQLEASPAVVSRAFKKTYGIPPVRYRHHVRIMDALTRLAEGAYPIEVFQDVGFDDLSRFYKLFRKVACSTPGLYRSRRSKNAKTRTD
jgi:AraC-like DNA-binding protein